MGNQDGISEIELIKDPGQIVHQGIQIVPGAGRIRAAMASAIRNYTPEAVRRESGYVATPDIRLEGPRTEEDDGATRSPVLNEKSCPIPCEYEGSGSVGLLRMTRFWLGLGQDGRRSHECRRAQRRASNDLSPVWFVHEEQFPPL